MLHAVRWLIESKTIKLISGIHYAL